MANVPGEVTCEDCSTDWPPGLEPLLKREGGCPACRPDAYGDTSDRPFAGTPGRR